MIWGVEVTLMFVLLPRFVISRRLNRFQENNEKIESEKYVDYYMFISFGVAGPEGISEKPPLTKSSNVRQFERLFLPQENGLVTCLLYTFVYPFHVLPPFPHPLPPIALLMTCAFFNYRGSADKDYALEGKGRGNRRRRCYGGVRTIKTWGCGSQGISKYGSFFFSSGYY